MIIINLHFIGVLLTERFIYNLHKYWLLIVAGHNCQKTSTQKFVYSYGYVYSIGKDEGASESCPGMACDSKEGQRGFWILSLKYMSIWQKDKRNSWILPWKKACQIHRQRKRVPRIPSTWKRAQWRGFPTFLIIFY